MKTFYRKNDYGYTLIEVLLGIVIFAVGMLALAQLQTHLTRNSTDANARTVGINIAEELIEQVRTFGQIDSSDDGLAAYNDITEARLSQTITRQGNVFTVVAQVVDYYYDQDSKEFTDSQPAGITKSDFKKVDLTVTWNSNQEFSIDPENQSQGRLGSGSVQVSEVISSITSASAGKVALNAAGSSAYSPEVDYEIDNRPGVVPIKLGDNKFKVSTTPLPDVIREDELVETSFDVVTYSNPNNGTGSTFLRREEFRAVSCECTLKLPGGDGEIGGMRPTVWNGSDYTEGEYVKDKAWGVSANNQQSQLCSICCRDHHDGGSSENDSLEDPGMALYSPFRSSSDYHQSGGQAGNHKHFSRGANGELVLVEQDGARYVEACRMIRKDGFFRVAQDLRQEGLNAFPADYLDDDPEINEYSQYVTDAVGLYKSGVLYKNDYELSPPDLVKPGQISPAVVFPASNFANATLMSTGGVESQQLRSRGIYLDYMSEDLRQKIICLDAGGSGEDCDVPRVSSALEIIPFYDVQLTWLSSWNETPSNVPIDVTNERISDDNQHSRGLATLIEGSQYVNISSTIHGGNLGLTGTDPIDEHYDADEQSYQIYAKAVDPSSPPATTGVFISGSILSSVNGLKAADVAIEAKDARCDRTNTGFECELEFGAWKPSLRVYNYDKSNKEIYACSSELLLEPPREHISLNGTGSWTNFSLDVSSTITTDIVLKEGGC